MPPHHPQSGSIPTSPTRPATTAAEFARQLAEQARILSQRLQASSMLAAATASTPAPSDPGLADMLAQALAYGLFAVRFAPVLQVPLTLAMLQGILGSLFPSLDHSAPDFATLGLASLDHLLDRADLAAVLRDFQARHPGEDPLIHFYELFLKEYAPGQRRQHGVFYTPRAVAAFIVRSAHEALRREFGLPDGLADTTTWGEFLQRNPGLALSRLPAPAPGFPPPGAPFVQILDPAAGTAAFLVEVIDVIHHTMFEKWRSEGLNEAQCLAAWRAYVSRHLLPRLHGCELLPAPCAIARLKVALKLAETGYPFSGGESIDIALANALDPPPPDPHKPAPRFTVVIGNPPYANFGRLNRSPFIMGLLEDYKRGLAEKKLNLDDDFIKFIRLGQHCIEQSGAGLLALITNNTFLDGPTRRGMRRSLAAAFPVIRILDLHGGAIERERAPDGSPDQNVFEIQQGVAITLFLRPPGASAMVPVLYHAHLYGSRVAKIARLSGAGVSPTFSCACPDTPPTPSPQREMSPEAEPSISNIKFEISNSQELASLYTPGVAPFQPLSIAPPLYRFQPHAAALSGEYQGYFPLNEIFATFGSGISTDRDALCYDLDRDALAARMRLAFSGRFPAGFAARYRIADSSSYDLTRRLRAGAFDPAAIHPCLYRLFDTRWLYYQPGFTSRPAWPVMRHLLSKDVEPIRIPHSAFRIPNRADIHKPVPGNLALLAKRQARDGEYNWFFVTSGLVVNGLFSIDNKGREQVFPLYLLDDNTRHPNFTPRFIEALLDRLGSPDSRLESRAASESSDSIRNPQSEFRNQRFRIPHSAFRISNTGLTPEDVLHYIYAVFHSPAYRTRYLDFLTLDFPRLPLTPHLALFRDLARLGGELVSLHLLSAPVPQKKLAPFTGPAAPVVEKASWAHDTIWIDKARTTGFHNVPQAVWQFQIGGHQVCAKWLKDRKGRTLSSADLAHFQCVLHALAGTLRLMPEIDATIARHGGWPDAF